MQNFLKLSACAITAGLLSTTAHATVISTLGDQDFSEGQVLFSTTEFLTPQTGEPSPIGILTDPTTVTWTHTFTPSADAAELKISLWDLDANFPGNQVSVFSVNGIGQDLSIFEAFQDGDRVHIYTISLPAGSLSTGTINVSLSLGNLETNAVGLDFAELSTVIPSPSAIAVLGLGGLLAARRRRA